MIVKDCSTKSLVIENEIEAEGDDKTDATDGEPLVNQMVNGDGGGWWGESIMRVFGFLTEKNRFNIVNKWLAGC